MTTYVSEANTMRQKYCLLMCLVRNIPVYFSKEYSITMNGLRAISWMCLFASLPSLFV